MPLLEELITETVKKRLAALKAKLKKREKVNGEKRIQNRKAVAK